MRAGTLWLLAAMTALIWFSNLDYRRLIKTDEGRYAEIAREMAASGDWVTPRSNDFKYFYKPPLQYWATAAAFKAFGVNEWTARLYTGLTGFLGIVVTFWFAHRLWGTRTAVAAAAVIGGAAMWVAMGHFAALDMGLAFFLATAVFAFVAAQSGDQRDRSRLMRIAWAAAGLAVMSKGLIGVVLPGAAFVAYLAWTRDGSLLRRLHWASGLAIFALVTVPWFVLVAARNHEFLHFFFIHEHFERFTTTVHGRYEPPWYFIPVLAVGFFPFTLAIGHAIAAGLRRAPGVFQPERFLLAWCVVVFAFFSASSSKLPSYLLPILPALAVLAALGLERMSRGLRALQWLAFALCGAAVAIAAPLVTARPSSSIPADQLADYLPWLVASGVAFALGGAVAWGLERRMRALAATVVAGLGGLVGAQLALTGHESLSRTYSAYHVARAALPTLTPDTRLFAVDTYDHALPFYLRRTLTMVAYKDELAQAIAWEPEKFLPDYAAFRREWAASPRAMAFMDPREYETFAKEGLPMTLVARDEKRVIVAKP